MVKETFTWEREEVFREPDGFRIEYEEINEVPFIHFTFLTRIITPSLVKMLEIVDTEICDTLYLEGFDRLFTYTNIDNLSVIRFAKKLGYKEFGRTEDQILLVKDLIEGRE